MEWNGGGKGSGREKVRKDERNKVGKGGNWGGDDRENGVGK